MIFARPVFVWRLSLKDWAMSSEQFIREIAGLDDCATFYRTHTHGRHRQTIHLWPQVVATKLHDYSFFYHNGIIIGHQSQCDVIDKCPSVFQRVYDDISEKFSKLSYQVHYFQFQIVDDRRETYDRKSIFWCGLFVLSSVPSLGEWSKMVSN